MNPFTTPMHPLQTETTRLEPGRSVLYQSAGGPSATTLEVRSPYVAQSHAGRNTGGVPCSYAPSALPQPSAWPP